MRSTKNTQPSPTSAQDVAQVVPVSDEPEEAPTIRLEHRHHRAARVEVFCAVVLAVDVVLCLCDGYLLKPLIAPGTVGPEWLATPKGWLYTHFALVMVGVLPIVFGFAPLSAEGDISLAARVAAGVLACTTVEAYRRSGLTTLLTAMSQQMPLPLLAFPVVLLGKRGIQRLREVRIANKATNTNDTYVVGILPDEVHELIDRRVSDILADKNAEIQELRFWRWGARTLVFFIIGSTIFGVSKLQELLDDRIAVRIGTMQELTIASNLVDIGKSGDAMRSLDAYWSATNFGPAGLTETHRAVFYSLALKALANNADYGVTNWDGWWLWNRLLSDTGFQQRYLTVKVAQDSGSLQAVGICQLKFAMPRTNVHSGEPDINNPLDVAEGYFRAADDVYRGSAYSSGDPGTRWYRLLIALVKSDEARASDLFWDIVDRTPPQSIPPIDYFRNDVDNFVQSSTFRVVDIAAERQQIFDLADRYRRFLDKLRKQPPKQIPVPRKNAFRPVSSSSPLSGNGSHKLALSAIQYE